MHPALATNITTLSKLPHQDRRAVVNHMIALASLLDRILASESSVTNEHHQEHQRIMQVVRDMTTMDATNISTRPAVMAQRLFSAMHRHWTSHRHAHNVLAAA